MKKNLKSITQKEFDEILRKHKNWLSNKKGGRKAKLTGYDLKNIDFRGANLKRADISESDLSSVDFSDKDVILEEVNFVEAILKGANFHDVVLEDCEFSASDLENAVFRGADLTGSYMDEAILRNVNFSEANLQSVNFTKSRLLNSLFRSSNLSETDFTEADIYGCDFDNAIYDGTIFINTKNKNKSKNFNPDKSDIITSQRELSLKEEAYLLEDEIDERSEERVERYFSYFRGQIKAYRKEEKFWFRIGLFYALILLLLEILLIFIIFSNKSITGNHWFYLFPIQVIVFVLLYFILMQYSKVKELRVSVSQKVATSNAYFGLLDMRDENIKEFIPNISSSLFSRRITKCKDVPIEEFKELIKLLIKKEK